MSKELMELVLPRLARRLLVMDQGRIVQGTAVAAGEAGSLAGSGRPAPSGQPGR